jgi:dCTP deaminase
MMTIKADRWIRRMALDHGMIEPFVDRQVRSGIISFGLSSYGYDMRVSDEFKVFTNVFNTIVDPKHFDPRSFVDIKADYCDIPPNSFALARSVEYFRVPRNVACLVIGKSTYARCFSGDTQVRLVDGTSIALEEMADRSGRGESFWGYSIGPHGRIMVTLLEHPRCIGRDSLIKITLDNNESIRCTPDHHFILRDGRTVPADQLRPDSALMPLYTGLFRGYEGVYQPMTGHYTPTHRLADEWNIRHAIYEDVPGAHRHHIDHDRRNNNPWNLVRVLANDHIRYHNAEYYDGPDFDRAAHGHSISEALSQLRTDPAWAERFDQGQRDRAVRFWASPEYAAVREQLAETHRAYWRSAANREAQRERLTQLWADPMRRHQRSIESREAWARDDGSRRARQRDFAGAINVREEITEERVRWALDTSGSIRGAAKLLDCDRSVFRRFPDVMKSFRGTSGTNHRVVAVRALPGLHDVYCLTVPEAGNFALAAGVFTLNCGIIINITPLEPAWSGHVTLEISNTTPLPARIYANEGIGQVLFFEGDEAPEVSYADKQGKYQGQQGIVLPRIDADT